MAKTDGCALGDGPDGNDWIVDCDLQRQLYWAAHEIAVYLEIVA